MRRLLITMITAASLMFGAAAAQAHGPGGASGAGGPGFGGWDANPQTVLVGTIQSVDSSAGTFVANAYIVNHGHGGFDGDAWGHQQQPATTQVTISTDSSTNFDVDGHSGTIDTLAQGQKFDAVLSGSPNGDLQTFLSSTPASSVTAWTLHTILGGTIVSVDPGSDSFVANVIVAPGRDHRRFESSHRGHGHGRGHFGRDGDWNGSGPPTTQLTITTGPNTKFEVDGQSATIDDLSQGQNFSAVFDGSASGDEQTFLNGNPAVSVFARTPHARKQLYAFVGSVTGVDTANGTVTVDITRTLPSDLAAAGSTATFTVGSDTLVLGGSGSGLFGGSLSNVSVGDIVAGGVTAPSGDTLTQIEALPLRILLDLPATSSAMASKASRAHARTHALDKALSLLGEKKSKSHKSKKSRKHHAHTESDRVRTHAKHA